MLLAMSSIAVGGPPRADAAELSDYLWQKRPLLLFAPSDDDPMLAETLSRIGASRCDVLDRDMVIGVVVPEGASTLDGQAINADQAQQLAARYGIDPNTFSALLIGKDGSEKLRVSEVPDLKMVFAVIDGMPMRIREMNDDPDRC